MGGAKGAGSEQKRDAGYRHAELLDEHPQEEHRVGMADEELKRHVEAPCCVDVG